MDAELIETINNVANAIDFVGRMVLVMAVVGGATVKVNTHKNGDMI